MQGETYPPLVEVMTSSYNFTSTLTCFNHTYDMIHDGQLWQTVTQKTN